MSKSKSRTTRRKNVQRTRTIETLEKREMFSTAPWGGQVEIELAVEPPTAVVASNPSEQVAVSFDDGGILNVVGTQEDDSIHVRENRHGQVIVESDGDEIFRTQRSDDVQQLRIDGHDGDDHIRNDTSLPSIITGGDGRDRLIGGSGDDVLLGQKGRDRLNGRRGDDILIGGKGEDKLNGGPGRDSIDNRSPLAVLPGLLNNVAPLPKPTLPTEIDEKGSSSDETGKEQGDRKLDEQQSEATQVAESHGNQVATEVSSADAEQPNAGQATETNQRADSTGEFATSKAVIAPNKYYSSSTKTWITLKGDGPYSVQYGKSLVINNSELFENDQFTNVDYSKFKLVEGSYTSKLGGKARFANGRVTYNAPASPTSDTDSFRYVVEYNGENIYNYVTVKILDIPPVATGDSYRYCAPPILCTSLSERS